MSESSRESQPADDLNGVGSKRFIVDGAGTSTSMTRFMAFVEHASVLLLCAATVAAPLALGSTSPWPRFVLEATMAVAAAAWALSGAGTTAALLAPLAIVALVLLQLVPLPDRILVGLAPVSAGRWKAALEGMNAGWATISVDPAATAAAIRRGLVGLATVAAVTGLARTPAHRRRFYTALATSAVLIWAAGIAFPVDPDHRAVMGWFNLRGPIEFWKAPQRSPLQTSGCGDLDWVTVGDQRYQADGPISGDGFGTYIYSNHFANALCLTLPAVWALWMMVAIRRRLPLAVRYGALLACMSLAGWTTGAVAHSRAGCASLGFAAITYLALVAQSRWLRWPTGAAVAVIVLGLVFFVAAFQGPFSGLLEVLPGFIHAKLAAVLVDTRIVAAKVAGRMFLASPLLGTGLGTYGDLYPGLLRGEHTLFFAHNDYAQLLAECGLLGGALLAGAGATLGWRLWRFCRERSAAGRQIDAGAWAAVSGAAAHAVFDWGMHAPANALLACIVMGLALSSVVSRAGAVPAGAPRWWHTCATVGFVVAILMILPFLARDAHSAATLDALRQANTAARVAALKPDSPSPVPMLESAIAKGRQAARFDPGNWQLSVLLGHANLHLAERVRSATERDAMRRSADDWFGKARRSSAVPRGIPEPLPRKTATPGAVS